MVIRWKLNEVMSRRRVRNKDLAEALDITENSIYRLRKTDEMPRLTPQRLEGICAVLGCQPGELLEWVPSSQVAETVVQNVMIYAGVPQTPLTGQVVVQGSPTEFSNMSKQALQRLTQFYQQVLALAWQGYKEFGPGAVIFTDLEEGPRLAYLEKDKLSNPNCHYVIEKSRPEVSAVVLYYRTDDYSTSDYEILTLTGPKSPPECYALLKTY